MDFDEDRIYYSYQNLQSQTDPNNEDTTDQNGINNANIIDDDGEVDLRAVRRHFREFLRKLSNRAFFPLSSQKLLLYFNFNFLKFI